MRSFFITDQKEIEEIIRQSQICFVGLKALDGSPYVLPMNFGYIDGNIVLHSAPEGTHLECIEQDNRVCVTFCAGGKLRNQHTDVACSYSMESRSVLCKGQVSFIEDDDEKIKYLNALMKNYSKREFTYSAPAVRNVKVWLVKVEETTARAVGQNYK